MITLSDYNEIVEKYDRTNFKNNNYLLSLANGDIINIKIPENTIAHLLGVDVDYLRNSNKIKPNINSYEILKTFLNDSYSFSKLCSNNGSMKFDNIFSKNIYNKLDAFDINTHITTANLLYIIKYDKEKTYQVEDYVDVSDYFIIKKLNDNCYYILGLVKLDNSQNIYVPTTSRKYDDETKFNEFITRIANKQELTYAYSNHIYNYINSYDYISTLNLDNKINTLKDLIEYAKKYNATAAVAYDFSYVISKNKNTLKNQSNIYNLILALSEKLSNGNVLDQKTISKIIGNSFMSEDMENLINICNNLICSKSSKNDASISYSQINDENKNLKEELMNLKQELQTLKTNNNNLINENEKLRIENNIYNEQFSIIENAYQKVKKSLN